MRLCECGCGNPTRVAPRTDTRTGAVKGQPLRFISRHAFNQRGPKSLRWRGGASRNWRYVRIKVPGHPNADVNGWVLEHVVVASKAMGKALPAGSRVHHVNGDPSDNRNRNLVVCDSDAYHQLLHRRARALQESGNANNRYCAHCHQWDDPKIMYVNGRHAAHRKCGADYARNRRKAVSA